MGRHRLGECRLCGECALDQELLTDGLCPACAYPSSEQYGPDGSERDVDTAAAIHEREEN